MSIELKVSQVVSDRLLAEARDLLEGMEIDPPSVGDAEVVFFTEEFSEEFDIGMMGRMTLKAGQAKFFAAPRVLDSKVHFEMDSYNLMDYVSRWDSGDRTDPPLEKMVQGPSHPSRNKIRTRDIFYSYERSLLLRILHEDNVVLYNPSCKTMSSLLSCLISYGSRTGYVKITSSMESEWVEEVLDFISKSKGRLRLVQKGVEVQGIGYLGTNSPLCYPDRWYRLIPSPFLDPNWNYHSYSINHLDDCVEMTFDRSRGHYSVNHLPRDPLGFLFNPETVDDYLAMGKMSQQMFFLETTEELDIRQIDLQKVFHTPWFVDATGEWVEIDGWSWKVRDNLVLDVEGTATYLSRRKKIPPNGYVWVPLGRVGTHWLTYSSLSPRRARDVHVFNRSKGPVIALGDVTLVSNVSRLNCQVGWIHVDRGTVREGEDFFPLMGDSVCMVRGEDSDIRALPYVYGCDEGFVFDRSHLHKDGLWYQPDKEVVDSKSVLVPYLPGGRVVYVSVFRTSTGNYIDLPYDSEGYSFIINSLLDITRMVHNLTMLSPKFHSFREMFTPIMDPDYGGTVNMNALAHQVQSVVSLEVVVKENDRVQTVSQISSRIGRTSFQVYDYMSRVRDYVVWVPDSPQRCQFVTISGVQVVLPGSFENGFINGVTWGSTIASVGKKTVLLYRGRPPLSYLSFLRRNFVSVRVIYNVTGITRIVIYRMK